MNIDILQKVVLDKGKLAELVSKSETKELRDILGVKAGQITHLRKGQRKPSADGLIRLMLLYGVTANDLATVEIK